MGLFEQRYKHTESQLKEMNIKKTTHWSQINIFSLFRYNNDIEFYRKYMNTHKHQSHGLIQQLTQILNPLALIKLNLLPHFSQILPQIKVLLFEALALLEDCLHLLSQFLDLFFEHEVVLLEFVDF